MQLSVVIPVFNEMKYIRPLLDSLLFSDNVEKEIFLADGGSTDGTIDVINAYAEKYPNVHLVHNEKKFVSFGFNKVFPLAKGKYITLMGAHALYPDNFFPNGIKYLEANECDAVGGPMHQDSKSPTGKAIAYAMSSKFGVGDTEFRTEKKKMYVDSVAFAIYRKSVFDDIGLLDVKLIRNQDDELHYRLNAAGYKMLMVPEMEYTYYVRDTLKGLFKQYYQYGLYKPMVLKKIKEGIRLRHLVPAFFCLYLFSLPLAILYTVWLLPLLLYFVLACTMAFKASLSFSQRLTVLMAFPVLHLSYGLGFLRGLFWK